MRMFFLPFIALLFSCLSFSAGLSPKAYRQLNDLQQAVLQAETSEQQQSVKQQLLSLKTDLAFNSTGLALTLQTLAQLEFLQGNQSNAISYLNEALLIENLDKPIYLQVITYLAQVLFNAGDYLKTIELIYEIEKIKPKEDLAFDYALLAASFYSLDQVPKGLPYIEKAISLKQSPKEAWLQMAFSGCVMLKRYDSAISYINKLVYEYPNKKEYWLQKSSVHQLAGDFQRASNVKELAYLQGYIDTDSDFINLAQLLASQGDPFKVAMLLQREIAQDRIQRSEKIQRLIYSALLEAKEIDRAIDAMKVGYEKYGSVQDGLLLSQYLVEKERWQEARDSLMQLIADKSLAEEQNGEVLFLLGISQFRLDDSKAALISLGKASALPKTSSKAKSWMNYIKQFDS